MGLECWDGHQAWIMTEDGWEGAGQGEEEVLTGHCARRMLDGCTFW